jgi:small multidrug resistance pump
MTGPTMLWLGGAMAIFIAAASALRRYVDTPQAWLLVAALILYSVGNLMMVRLMKETGLAATMSISAVLQLVLINLVAVFLFGERPTALQASGIALGILAVALIVWPSGAKG